MSPRITVSGAPGACTMGVVHEPPYMDIVRNGDDVTYSGYIVDVLNAAAARGGFTYTFTALDESALLAGEETYTDLLMRTVSEQRFDVLASGWYDTAERRRLGVLFGRRIIDVSGYVVAPKNDAARKPSAGQKIALFTKPFSWGVWAIILSLLFFQASIMFFLERHRMRRAAQARTLLAEDLRREASERASADAGGREVRSALSGRVMRSVPTTLHNAAWRVDATQNEQSVLHTEEPRSTKARLAWLEAYTQSAYETISHVSQAEDAHVPVSWIARMQNIVWCFLVLLIISAYTANLATFLIVRSQPMSSITGIGDLMVKRLPTCVPTDTGLGEFVQAKYRSLNVVDSPWLAGIDRLVARQCAAIIMPLFDAQQALASGPGCELGVQGQPLVDLSGAFAYSPSSGNGGCGPQVMVVIDTLLSLLSEDNVMQELWEPYVQPQCPGEDDSLGLTELEEKVALTVEGFSGPFLVYGCATAVFMTIAVALHLTEAAPHRLGKKMDSGVTVGVQALDVA
ncbi:unnamed protein product [Pedinophyceae sp. YPF-701]|nr:unnamed protein product [Pedinophyceae sp. YPF-701]